MRAIKSIGASRGGDDIDEAPEEPLPSRVRKASTTAMQPIGTPMIVAQLAPRVSHSPFFGGRRNSMP
ncbi:MAG TPA: hypothetical protein VEW07_12965 [Solirubrobacterales bacterium]|nr:hypothetical protein [Solirubrobacterales bacterium]